MHNVSGHVKIKLCGLTRREDIECVNRLRPEIAGFVFAEKSRRYLPPGRAAELRRLLAPGILAAGVFVNEDPARIRETAAAAGLDIVQLHGSETEEDVLKVKRLTGLTVVKAFSVSAREDLRAAFRSPADFVLLDNGAGGTGEQFDWSLLEGFGRPYFLAGGLDAENVGSAVRRLSPYAVDVSSALETDGKKDPGKMKAFVEAVRSALD